MLYYTIPTVLELGAGCALPSLLAATGRFPTPPPTDLSHTGTLLHPPSSSSSSVPSHLPSSPPRPDDDNNAPALVVITDFPDPSILSTLQQNVTQNRPLFAPGCDVRWAGYEWGESVEGLLYVLYSFYNAN
jgi:EEF1A N-terminal glycine/lysine methyltransferase